MIRRPPRSTQSRSSAASDVYKRQEREDAPAKRLRGISVLLDEDRARIGASDNPRAEGSLVRKQQGGALVLSQSHHRAVVGQSKYGCDFILCVGYEDVELVIAWWRAIVRARHETATAGTGLDHSGARSD